MGIPVADHETVQAHTAFEHIGQQPAVAVHFHALPTRIRRHHRLRPGSYRGRISGSVDVTQLRLAGAVVSLVASTGASIAEEMLRGSDHMRGVQELWGTHFALQAFDHGGCVLPYDLRIF